MEFSDRVLAVGLLPGDPKAFHRMFETFFPRVFNDTCLHLGHSQKAETATEEILTEAIETIGQDCATAAGSLAERLFNRTRRHTLEMAMEQTALRTGRLTPTGDHAECFKLEKMLLESVVQS